jgi:hypothetical protein
LLVLRYDVVDTFYEHIFATITILAKLPAGGALQLWRAVVGNNWRDCYNNTSYQGIRHTAAQKKIPE